MYTEQIVGYSRLGSQVHEPRRVLQPDQEEIFGAEVINREKESSKKKPRSEIVKNEAYSTSH